ncbi:MAG: hypothetical protein R3303_15210, partial [Marinobacter sp.]|nr:hypothetical protein [Marinobacter sp.]
RRMLNLFFQDTFLLAAGPANTVRFGSRSISATLSGKLLILRRAYKLSQKPPVNNDSTGIF